MHLGDARLRRLAAVVLSLQVGAAAVGVASDRLLAANGHGELAGVAPEIAALLVGVLVASLVGAAIIRDQPRHPVGWLFLALSGVIILSGLIEATYDWDVVAGPGTYPVVGFLASVDNSSWIAWFVLIALVLGLTPTGSWTSPRMRIVGRATAAAGGVAFLLSLFRTELDPPYDDVDNPVAVDLPVLTGWLVYLLVLGVAVGLVVCGGSLVTRWRRSEGTERLRLLWLALVVVPLPVFVVAAFAAAHANNDSLMLYATCGFVVLVPVAAGLSITRYHLYDVERVLARTTTYVLLTVILVATYAGIVWFGARSAGRWSTSPEVAATVGALAAAVLAAPLRTQLQDAIDRRFNRRRYDAVRMIRTELDHPEPVRDLAALFRRALADPSLAISYPGAETGAWVTGAGEPTKPAGAIVDVVRHGRLAARISFDPGSVDGATVNAAAQVAGAELDNARLRAELAGRLVEVESSRRRIVEAQRTERRRIERDLHDGAQQQLLALAFELQSAGLSQDPDRMRTALTTGATTAQQAVQDLRALANGLHPAALQDGGLPAALDDLRSHVAVPMTLTVDVDRLPPAVEFTAWLVLGEAVVNAQKHAAARSIEVEVCRQDEVLHLRVRDDGRGGANPAGTGLRGLRDRVEAAGGTLTVDSQAGRGTRLEAVIPCGS